MKLLQKYQAAMKDPELLSLRESLAILEIRGKELLERADSGESADRWRMALEAWSDFKGKRNSLFEPAAFAKLNSVMEDAMHDYASWRQLFDIFELRRKLSESERKRLLEMQQIITAEDAAKLITALQMAVIRIVDDSSKLKLIEYEFIRLSGVGGVQEPKERVDEEQLFDASTMDTGTLLDS